jgi:DNA-binding NarL/FixJ family response regulator
LEVLTVEDRKTSRVVIAEDHKMLRDMLRTLFDSDPGTGITVVGEAENGSEAVQCVAQHHPDLVLMDLSMPMMNGHQAILEIKKAAPETKILVLTMYSAQEVVESVLKAGADGYVLKRDSLAELRAAITNVLEGNSYLSPEVSKKVLHGYRQAASHADAGSLPEIPTPREREIIKLVAEGLKSKEIAESLGISLKTVETHRSNTMKKLGLRNAAELTAYAVKEGLVKKPILKGDEGSFTR